MNGYVPKLFHDATLADFGPDKLTDVAWDGNVPATEPGMVYLFGATGRGKTHLAFALIREWAKPLRWPYQLSETSAGTRWISVPNAILDARAARSFSARPNEAELLDEWQAPRLMLIDDLSMPDGDQQAWQLLFSLIDFRLNNQLATIVTSNVRPDRFEARLADRFEAFRLGTMVGESQRGRAV